ncbi:hypothetical protein FRY97_21845 [Phaeodactylibacter luteus]|uniref:HEAT repeat domain-containing protein n=2 Tax=Phaeodactylibacter luteus TaxID=1564516 RepID=A0A5C6RER9_9BACT|nr:hypothetical protein FRY97_21845 [Phaeodactylibacter luteus]
MEKNKKYIALLIMILTQSLMFGQSNNFAEKVSTYIELPKDTLLLGEPAFFNYVLKNNSDESIYVEEGGDYRSGRKISFNVYIISSDNDTLKKRELWGAMGGRIGFHEIKAKESRKFKLFLPMWGDIERADNYKLSVSKKFRIAKSNPFLSRKTNYDNTEIVPKESSILLPVIDNQEELGNFIYEMIEDIKEETKGRVIEGPGFKTGERTYKPMSERLAEYLRIIHELKDDRIVPFLIDCYNNNEYFTRNRAINYLSRYPNNENVLEVLIDASNGADNSKYEIFEDSISISWSSDYTRQVALLSIMKFKDEKAINYLVSKNDDDFPHERYMILIRAKFLMSEEDRLRIYHAFEDDEHLAVVKKAKEELELMNKE